MDEESVPRRLDLTVGAVIVHEGRVLLLQHKKRGMWLFPGGHIEPNETPDAATIREVKEETGLDILFLHTSPPPKTADELEHLHLPIYTNTHEVGDHDHYCMYFLCAPLDVSQAWGAEGQAVQWFTSEEMRELRTPQTVRNIALWALQAHSTRKPL